MPSDKKNTQHKARQKTIARGRLNGAQRHRLRKLLHMKYKPSELAEEIGFNVRWVYDIYLPLGCPHERDTFRYVWIVGSRFREWYLETYRKRKLAENEAYCVSCKQVVSIVDPETHEKEGLTYLLFKCPECERTAAKILAMNRRKL